MKARIVLGRLYCNLIIEAEQGDAMDVSFQQEPVRIVMPLTLGELQKIYASIGASLEKVRAEQAAEHGELMGS